MDQWVPHHPYCLASQEHQGNLDCLCHLGQKLGQGALVVLEDLGDLETTGVISTICSLGKGKAESTLGVSF